MKRLTMCVLLSATLASPLAFAIDHHSDGSRSSTTTTPGGGTVETGLNHNGNTRSGHHDGETSGYMNATGSNGGSTSKSFDRRGHTDWAPAKPASEPVAPAAAE